MDGLLSPEKTVVNGASQLGIELSGEQVEHFILYMDILKLWSEKVNITSILDDNSIVIKHFLDSLTILKLIPDDSKVLDIGSGGGFPGIALKIVNPSLRVTLLDSVEKKVFFMKDVIRRLGLASIQAVKGRAGEYIKDVPSMSYDFVATRAVGSICSIVDIGTEYLVSGGRMLLMRGKRGLEEWRESEETVLERYSLVELDRLSLPFGGGERVNIVIEVKG